MYIISMALINNMIFETIRNFLYRAECQFKKDWTETCLAFRSSCYNPNSSELREFSFEEQFKQKELTLQQYFDDFSYDSTCANI